MYLPIAVLLFVTAGLVVAADPMPSDAGSDEAPLRLKKKNKPPLPVPGKDDLDKKPVSEDQPPIDEGRDAKDEAGGERPVGEGDFQDVFERIGKNMRLAEDRLDNKELGDGLRAIQGDIVKDLDALIKGQQQQQQSGGGGSSSSRDSGGPQQSNQGGGSRRQQKQQTPVGMRNQPRRDQGSGQVARNDWTPRTPKGSGSTNNPTGPGQEDKGSSASPLDDVAKQIKDAWGHLPAAKRAEMDAYAREKFMTKYDDLIRKYYETLSETSRRAAGGR
jgi:hypothetical protein